MKSINRGTAKDQTDQIDLTKYDYSLEDSKAMV